MHGACVAQGADDGRVHRLGQQVATIRLGGAGPLLGPPPARCAQPLEKHLQQPRRKGRRLGRGLGDEARGLPLHLVADLSLPPGVGDKAVLRTALRLLGLPQAAARVSPRLVGVAQPLHGADADGAVERVGPQREALPKV